MPKPAARWAIAILVLASALLGLAAGPGPAWVLGVDPQWTVLTPPERFDIEAQLRSSLVASVSAFLVVAGLVVALGEYWNARQQAHLERQAQLTALLLEAVRQINSASATEKLAGILGLSKLSAQSTEDRNAVASLLVSFIKKQRHEPGELASELALRTLDSLTPGESQKIDLRGSYLVGLNLAGVNLTKFDLDGCDIRDTEIG